MREGGKRPTSVNKIQFCFHFMLLTVLNAPLVASGLLPRQILLLNDSIASLPLSSVIRKNNAKSSYQSERERTQSLQQKGPESKPRREEGSPQEVLRELFKVSLKDFQTKNFEDAKVIFFNQQNGNADESKYLYNKKHKPKDNSNSFRSFNLFLFAFSSWNDKLNIRKTEWIKPWTVQYKLKLQHWTLIPWEKWELKLTLLLNTQG